MTNKTRDDHLKTLLPADVFAELDDAEKNVLYDEFSNSDVRTLGAQGLEALRRRISGNLTTEYQRRLSHIQPEEYKTLKPWYLEVCKTVNEIICSKCGALLGLEVDTIDDNLNPHHHEGKFIVAVGDKLMSYRPRLDGVMGYLCGNIIDVPQELKDETLADYEQKKEARRKELTKEISERMATDFENDSQRAIEEMVADETFPSIDTEKKAKKALAQKAPTKEDVATAVEINLDNEFPELQFREKMECGNNTLWSQIELDVIPEEHAMTSITKEDIVKVKQEVDAQNYTPDVTETKNGKMIETFELRKVK